MAPTSLCVCLVVVLAHNVLMAQGKIVTCRYADSILVNGTCFRYNSTPVTWAEGKAFCTSMNGALAKVDSKSQIAAALNSTNIISNTWIGANDIDAEGKLIWDHDQSPVGSSLTGLWGSGLNGPSNLSASFDCVYIYKSFTYYIVYASDCTSLYGTLCMENFDRAHTTLSPSPTSIHMGPNLHCPPPCPHTELSYINAILTMPQYYYLSPCDLEPSQHPVRRCASPNPNSTTSSITSSSSSTRANTTITSLSTTTTTTTTTTITATGTTTTKTIITTIISTSTTSTSLPTSTNAATATSMTSEASRSDPAVDDSLFNMV